jgi:hypothetical protein
MRPAEAFVFSWSFNNSHASWKVVCRCPMQVVDTDERIASIHYNSERFDWKAEGVFKYLQARPACVW